MYLRGKKISHEYTCKILEQKDEYDLQKQEKEEIKVICKQNFKIITLGKMDKFRTFYPLCGKPPAKFLCPNGPDGNVYEVNSEQLVDEPNGVNLPLSRQLMKTEREDLPPIIWEYENFPIGDTLRTAVIARPTSQLEICVNLPSDELKPKEHGWFPVNAEGESVGRLKRTTCLEVGDRICLYTKIKNVKEGLSYRIWWKY